MFIKDPKKRFTLNQVKNHAWMKTTICTKQEIEKFFEERHQDRYNNLMNDYNIASKVD